MRVLMLGSGTSSGVPRLGGGWGRCDPANPRNRRRRVSLLVEHGPIRLLVDTSPDLREQLLDAGVSRLDAVLFTHDHADHAHGLDDLRGVFHAMGRPVDCYMDQPTLRTLTTRFAYAFAGEGGYPRIATARSLEPELRFGDLRVRPFRQVHGPVTSTGYRFEADGKAVAYSTDVTDFPPDSRPLLEGLDLWIVEALRREPHPTHAHLSRTLDWIATFRPRLAVLTHLDQSMDHDELRAELPPGVLPGFDGFSWP
ncbi:MAG: MBL fold metallo-hydrolase [Sphingomonadaceae bacterium]|uniref:MBL fold metallo-hydrolase n=1 Tax=Thermaurantiacus sp. TaxID=2820283 RepID=UPI00298F152A|nr:MBL fold metallo-hydrolase [Thermaurantiacus sp.]MCS6985833.1 MBL fold metallo-hydrolase [Sphingomonadaceae bacterium]MDW8413898.1 MBL fold metallo-hydrolase [Thermaurantiacus sp.]